MLILKIINIPRYICKYIFFSDWWIKFFTNAGIPSFASSKYATIFYENRIQSNMLMDLDKDILKEMGISVIGDMIAILKHAKDVYRDVIIVFVYKYIR